MIDVGDWVAVNVFGDAAGSGSPMVVVRLASWPSADELGALAARLPSDEVTFVVDTDARCTLRWFGPLGEVPFCGHGALAAAALLAGPRAGIWADAIGGPSGRPLRLGRDDGQPALWMPAVDLRSLDVGSLDIGLPIVRLFDAGRDYLAVLADEWTLRSARPVRDQVLALPKIGLILSAQAAPGSAATAVFRFLAPRAGIDEDRVSCSVLPPLCALWAPPRSTTARFVQCSGIDVDMGVRQMDGGWQVSGPVHEIARGRCGDLESTGLGVPRAMKAS